MNKAVSAYMRLMQRRSAKVRWSGLSAAQKRERMSALAKRRWLKTGSQQDKTLPPALTGPLQKGKNEL